VNLFACEARGDVFKNQIIVARDKFLMGIFESRDRDQLAASRGSLRGFTQNTAKNAIQPGPYARRVAQLVQSQPGASAGLLYCILGVGPRASASRRKREQTIEMRQDERIEARVPFGERCGDQSIRKKRL
jgi:hypothetical protein